MIGTRGNHGPRPSTPLGCWAAAIAVAVLYLAMLGGALYLAIAGWGA